MVYFMLCICAELETLTNFQPQGGCDDPDFTYYFKLKCNACQEVTKKEICVSLNETVPLSRRRNTNLIKKGIEPLDFAFARGWKVKTVEGPNIIEDIDLSREEFATYRGDDRKPVKIYNVASMFQEVWLI